MSKNSEKLSLSETVKVNGVEIKKMPCGKYFEALQTLKNLPEDFIKQISSEGEEFKLSEMFTMENITKLITRLLIILPEFTFKFLSKLMDVDKEKLEKEITPNELLEIIKEFIRINDLESFFVEMKSMMEKITMLIGFKKQ